MELTALYDAPVAPNDAPVNYSPLLPTGVDAIDRAWGGLYRGGSYLLYGRGASGRDLLTLRFAQTGAELGESCLFISTARPKDLMIQAASIGFDLREAYEQQKVKLLRVPPTLAHQGGEDVGVLRAMRDLVALIREHRPQRLVVNDFMPFVTFRSYDRLRASIVDLLEQTDVLDMTMILMMSEPGNDQSRRVVEFVASQMTGAIHLEMVSDDPESTMRRLTFLPNIGHVRGRRSEPWDLSEMLKPTTIPVTAERRMLPAPPRMPEPPRYRGIRLSGPAPVEPEAAPAPMLEPAAVSAGIPLGRTFQSAPAPEPFFTAPPAAPVAGEAPPFVWTPEPSPIYPPAPTPPAYTAPEPTPAPVPDPAAPVRAALRPGATSLRSGAPRQAEMLPEVPTFGSTDYDAEEPVFTAPMPSAPAPTHPAPLPVYEQAPAEPVMPQPMPHVAPQPMPATAFGAPTATPYAPYAAPDEALRMPQGAPMPVNPYAAPINPAPQPMPPPAPMPVYEQAPSRAPYPTQASPYAPAPPAPAAPATMRMRAEATQDRAAFGRLLDEQFRLRSAQGTPFLLVAMRLEHGGAPPNPFDFEFISQLMLDALRVHDALLLDPQGERLVALLPGAQPEEAGAVFTRFKGRLRDEAPQQAEALLNTVSAIVLRNGEATTGEAFRNADAVLAYMLDNG